MEGGGGGSSSGCNSGRDGSNSIVVVMVVVVVVVDVVVIMFIPFPYSCVSEVSADGPGSYFMIAAGKASECVHTERSKVYGIVCLRECSK